MITSQNENSASIEPLGDAVAAEQGGDSFLAAQALQDNTYLVLCRILLAGLTADIAHRLLGSVLRRHRFLSHLCSP